MFGTLVSDMQEGLEVRNDEIVGTLKYLDEGSLVESFGPGNFMALKFTIPEGATSVKVGMEPSQGTGLVEIINDPDKNGAFKVTDEDTQLFKIVTSDGTNTTEKYFDLSSLTLETE